MWLATFYSVVTLSPPDRPASLGGLCTLLALSNLRVLPVVPMHESLVIEVGQYDGVCVVRCKGRFVSGANVEYLRSKIEQIRSLKCPRVLADFQEVPSIGSTGLAFIVAMYNSVVKEFGGKFVVAGALPFVRKALDLSRLSSVVSLASNAAAGMAVLRGQ